MAEQEFKLSIVPATTPRALEIYTTEQDPDKKAEILNNRLMALTSDNIATSGSVYTLRTLATLEEGKVIQYRPDAIAYLTDENLLAVAKNLTGEESGDPHADFMAVAKQIQSISARRKGQENSLKDAEASFSEHIFEELTERLVDDDPKEAGRLIALVEQSLSPSFLSWASRLHPEFLAVLITRRNEFVNPSLRTLLQETFEEQLNQSDDLMNYL